MYIDIQRLLDMLNLSSSMTHDMLLFAKSLLVALGLLAGYMASFRTILLGKQDIVMWVIRLVCCVVILNMYDHVVQFILDSSKAYVTYIQNNNSPETEKFWNKWHTALSDIAEKKEDNHTDKDIGFLKGSTLSWCIIIGHYIGFFMRELLLYAAAILLNILKIIGPLMFAIGIIGEGKTIKIWCRHFIQVSLWPVAANLLMLFFAKTHANVDINNTAMHIICVILHILLFIATPFLVRFICGNMGIDVCVTTLGSTIACSVSTSVSHIAPKALSILQHITPTSAVREKLIQTSSAMRPGERMAQQVHMQIMHAKIKE